MKYVLFIILLFVFQTNDYIAYGQSNKIDLFQLENHFRLKGSIESVASDQHIAWLLSPNGQFTERRQAFSHFENGVFFAWMAVDKYFYKDGVLSNSYTSIRVDENTIDTIYFTLYETLNDTQYVSNRMQWPGFKPRQMMIDLLSKPYKMIVDTVTINSSGHITTISSYSVNRKHEPRYTVTTFADNDGLIATGGAKPKAIHYIYFRFDSLGNPEQVTIKRKRDTPVVINYEYTYYQ